MSRPKPALLIILDGYGYSPRQEGNAVAAAKTPHLKSWLREQPSCLIAAAGEAVGLPAGQMGNSEVGHLNLGAGRVVYQEITRISKAVSDGSFFLNDALLQACKRAKATGGSLHLMGLLSDGGVHSHQAHLEALLELAKRQGLPGNRVWVHAFLDGRDTPPKSAPVYLEKLQASLAGGKSGRLATLTGRYYAMDRDNRWERVEKAWRAMVEGEGTVSESPAGTLEASYAGGVTDEFVPPAVLGAASYKGIQDGDSLIFFNFRADRAREISRAFVDPDFKGFPRPRFPKISFVCLTQYDRDLPAPVAFAPQSMNGLLGEALASAGLKQCRLAETEKYAHVTFFFNGGVEKAFEGEDRVLVPSPKVATYDLKPEMSAPGVAGEALKLVESGKHDVVIINFANSDMVGHTGIFDAAVSALEAVDEALGQVVQAVLAKGGSVLITADHGNSEQMVDFTSAGPFTAHTTNPVPFVILGQGKKLNLRGDGSLADVAPTLLEILQIPKPAEMTGTSLIAGRG
jgi:2,3-bisphosphoglycerate-independent phosphoglycerate mutase